MLSPAPKKYRVQAAEQKPDPSTQGLNFIGSSILCGQYTEMVLLPSDFKRHSLTSLIGGRGTPPVKSEQVLETFKKMRTFFFNPSRAQTFATDPERAGFP
jgi:hypothetical protein